MNAECLPSSERPEDVPRSSQHTDPLARRRSVALALAALLAASSAGAQNLLSNPEVTGTLAPWTVCGLNGFLSDDRHGSCLSSGSALAASDELDCDIAELAGTNHAVIRQCVPLAGTGIVPGSTEVYYSGWAMVDQTEPMWLSIVFFASADCSGSELDNSSRGMTAPTDEWVNFELDYTGVPVGTASIQYRLVAFDEVDNSTYLLSLDDAYFGTVPLLFADGFEQGSVDCRWSSHSS